MKKSIFLLLIIASALAFTHFYNQNDNDESLNSQYRPDRKAKSSLIHSIVNGKETSVKKRSIASISNLDKNSHRHTEENNHEYPKDRRSKRSLDKNPSENSTSSTYQINDRSAQNTVEYFKTSNNKLIRKERESQIEELGTRSISYIAYSNKSISKESVDVYKFANNKSTTEEEKKAAIKGSVPILKGVITHNSISDFFISRSYAAPIVCIAPMLELYDITTMTVVGSSSLYDDSLGVDTRFDININSLELDLQAPTRYLIRVAGCSESLERIVTSFYTEQDISFTSSLISKIRNTGLGIDFNNDIAGSTLEKLIRNVDNAMPGTSLDKVNAYTAISSDPDLQTAFDESFNSIISPSDLKESAPDIKSISLPQALNENVATLYTVEAEHWDVSGDYTIAYEWEVNDVRQIRPNSNDFTYTAPKNSSDTVKISLLVGKKNTGDQYVDRTRPFHRFDNVALVSDDFPVTSPSFSINTATSNPSSIRSIVLDINTGASLENCDTISSWLVTENATAPSASLFPVNNCSTANVQSEVFNINALTSDGTTPLYLWSIDKRGNISTPTSSSIVLDTTAPVITYVGFATNYRADDTMTLNWTISESHTNTALAHTIEFFDGTTWTTLPSINSKDGPLVNEPFQTTFFLPNILTTNAKFRITVADELAQGTTNFETPTFSINKPSLAISPNSFNFGNVANNSTSSNQLFTLSNTGPADTKLCSNITITGVDSTQFSIISDNCSNAILSSSGSCQIGIKATPNTKGAKTATPSLTCGSDTISGTISVNSTNVAPVNAANFSISAIEDNLKNFNVTAATDTDGDSLTYAVITPPANGVLANCLQSNGDLNCDYTPNANFNGTDSFSYQASDSITSATGVTNVTINVLPVNDAPTIPATQSVAVTEDTPLSFNLNSGTDIDLDTLTYTVTQAPASGALTCTGTSCSYTPTADTIGSFTFKYRVSDGLLNSSEATVTLIISNTNDAPVMISNQTEITNEDTAVNFTLTGANDIDIPIQTLRYKIINPPSNGVISNCINTSTYVTDISCTYTPAANFNGVDTFTYRANDSISDSVSLSTVTINVAPINDAPTSVATTVATNEDSAITFDLPISSDIENDTLTYIKVSNPANGSVSCLGGVSRSCTFIPNANFEGATSFTYKVNDGLLDSNTSTISITVNAVNDNPLTASDFSIAVTEDITKSFTLASGTDIDLPFQSLSYKLISSPSNGSLTNCINTSNFNSDLTCDYTPSLNYNGLDSFTYAVYDGISQSITNTTVNLTISSVNDRPVAPVDYVIATNEDTVLNFTLNDGTDIDGDTLTASIVTTPSSGTLSCTAYSCSYTPSLNYNGTDSFTYKISDSTTDSLTNTTVTINVTPINDAPVIGISQSFTVADNTVFNFTINAASDVDGDGLSYKIVSATTNGSISNCINTLGYGTDLTCTYTANVNFNGTDSFTYISNDSTIDSSSSQTIIFTVNDQTPPVIPSISLAHSQYRNIVTQQLTIASCTDIAGVFIGESSTPLAGDAGWQSCSTTSGAITYSLASATEGSHGLKAWFKDAYGNITAPTVNNVIYDITNPVITISATPSVLKGSANYTVNYTVTETNSSSSQTVKIQYYNGFAWTDLADHSALNGPLSNTLRSYTFIVPTIDVLNSKIKISYTDLAGNAVDTESNVFDIDSQAPVITIAYKEAYKANQAQTFSWTMTEPHIDAGGNFNIRYYNGSSWLNLGAVSSGAGPISNKTYQLNYNPGAATTAAKFEVSFTDDLGQQRVEVKDIVIDGSRPVVNGLTLNNGINISSSNNVVVETNGTDPHSNITYVCFKYDDNTPPVDLSENCWNLLDNAKRSKNLSLVSADNFYTSVGFVAKNYDVYAWYSDAAGNISINTGTHGVDRYSITYSPGSPPVLMNLSVSSTNNPSVPTIPSDITFTSGSDIYIKWHATDAQGLSATPINVYYTTDDVNFTLLQGGILNSASAGCTFNASETGCVKLTGMAPTSSSFKIRVSVVDSDSAVTYLTSVQLNETNFRIIAGNTEKGVGGSGQSIVYRTRKSSHHEDLNSVATSYKGDIFVIDVDSGLLWVNPLTGVVDVLIPTTGSSTGDGGDISNATLTYPRAITMDHKERLLIYDGSYIRRVDMSSTPWTITKIIGGGSSNDPGPSVPADQIKLSDIHKNYGALTPLPNGDIYFRAVSSGSSRTWWHYKEADGTVNRIQAEGDGIYNEPTYSWSGRSVHNLSLAYDALSSQIQHMQVTVHRPVTGNTYRRMVRLDFPNGSPTTTYKAIAPFDINANVYTTTKTGLDGVIYSDTDLRRRLNRYDHVNNTWTSIAGTGSTSAMPCPDGTVATSCPILLEGFFVNARGQVFMNDHGLIRTIDDSGNMVTISGQFPSNGDGGNALSSRIASSYSLDYGKHNALMNTIIVGDTVSSNFREFTIGGNINTVAGGYGTRSYVFSVDPATGDIYDDTGSGVNTYVRSSSTWNKYIGGGGTHYPDADGLVGTSVYFDWYSEQILGIGNGKVMVHKSRWDGTSRDAFVKLYDMTDSYRQSHFMGLHDVNMSSFGAAGTLAANSKIPTYGGIVASQYDPVYGWIVKQTSTSRIINVTADGMINEFATLPSSAYGFVFTYRSGKEFIYYCNSAGDMIEYNKTDTTSRTLSWGAPTIKCSYGQRRILYNHVNDSVVFLFVQNGLYGVAEYKM